MSEKVRPLHEEHRLTQCGGSTSAMPPTGWKPVEKMGRSAAEEERITDFTKSRMNPQRSGKDFLRTMGGF